MSEDNKQSKPPGFTCPNCGSHMFGTHTHYAVMGDQFPAGARVGSCHEFHYQNTECRHQWNRDDAVAESQNMHVQTAEEWQKSWQPLHGTPATSSLGA